MQKFLHFLRTYIYIFLLFYFTTHLIMTKTRSKRRVLLLVFIVSFTKSLLIRLFERAFKMMKNGVYFIRIALLVAELLKILVYAN